MPPGGADHALIVRLLYRSLLRVAKRFDAHPTTRFALHINPSKGPPANWTYYHEAVADYLQNKLYLMPEASTTPVASIVRRYFRIPDQPAPSSSRRRRARQQQKEEDERRRAVEAAAGDRLDAAFLALRELSKVWHSVESALLSQMARARSSSSSSSSSGRRRGKGGKDVEAEAEELPFPVKPTRAVGPGVLLLSHPMMHDDTFKRTAIYLIEHSPKEGAYGLIINALSDLTLPQAVEGGLAPEFFRTFSQNLLRRGGPVPRLQMLHQQEGVGGLPLARRGSPLEGPGKGPPPPPVFAGGDWKEATKTVRSGAAPADAFHFFCGASTWAPGQLESEMAKGFWIPVKGPPHVALEHRPRLWYEVLHACSRQQQQLEEAAAAEGGNGYSHAALLPEEGLDRIEPLAFD